MQTAALDDVKQGQMKTILMALVHAANGTRPSASLPPATPEDRDHKKPSREDTPTPARAPDLVSDTGIAMNMVHPGTFMMGNCGQTRSRRDRPAHQVALTRPFYLGVHPVTQQQYEQVMGDNPSHFRGADRPVENVSWHDAQAFCRALAHREGATYRLPTEAEWEYACQATSASAYCYGDSPGKLHYHAWYAENSGCTTQPVCGKEPNAWGLHDMHGSVREWCADWFALYLPEPQRDPHGPSEGAARVVRGGSWSNAAEYCHSAHRVRMVPDASFSTIGFRVVREVS
jgi:formylglycine-generating enzyme required for sulfatase activity